MVPSNHSNFQYCDSNIGLFSIAPCEVITLNPLCIPFGISSLLLFWWLFFSLLKVTAKRLPLLFTNTFKSLKERHHRHSWKSENFMGSNTEKKPWTNLQNLHKNLSIEIKSDNCFYSKVGRSITKWEKILFLKGNKIIFAFGW